MSPEMGCLFPSPLSGVLYVSLRPHCLSQFMADILFVHVAVTSLVINVCMLKCSSSSPVWRFVWIFMVKRCRQMCSHLCILRGLIHIFYLAYEWLMDINLSVLLTRETTLEHQEQFCFLVRCERELNLGETKPCSFHYVFWNWSCLPGCSLSRVMNRDNTYL